MKSTILVVDDLESNRIVTRGIFGDKYTLLEAVNGKACIEIAKAQPHAIDLVLLDLNMPGINGFDILRLRQAGEILKNVPVIVLTANENIEAQIKAFSLGAVDYITIPFVREIAEYRVMNALYLSEQLMELEQKRSRLRSEIENDQLTGLLNKGTMESMVSASLADGRGGVLFLFDIDNFKQVNDTYGHDVGDNVICGVADFIRRQFRRGDLVGRFGGDEYVVYMENIHDREIIINKAESILANLRDQLTNRIEQQIRISFGIAWCSKPQQHSISYELLFKAADTALYKRKNSGKNGYEICEIK